MVMKKLRLLLIYLIICLIVFSCSSKKNEKTKETPPIKADNNITQKAEVDNQSSEKEQPQVEQSNTENIVSSSKSSLIKQASLVPDTVDGRTVFKVKTVLSDDNKNIELRYEWFINGFLVVGNNTDTIGNFKGGDKVMVKITPFNGAQQGDLMVLTVTPKNLPPVITQHNNLVKKDDIYTYQVEAKDPDGDPIVYKLSKGHEGVTIDEKTGLITWKPKPDETGSFDVAVTVSDNHGASSIYNLHLALK